MNGSATPFRGLLRGRSPFFVLTTLGIITQIRTFTCIYHLVSTHAVKPGQNIADGVHTHVSHMKLARGVREHGKDVLFPPSSGILGIGHATAICVCTVLAPISTPFSFDTCA